MKAARETLVPRETIDKQQIKATYLIFNMCLRASVGVLVLSLLLYIASASLKMALVVLVGLATVCFAMMTACGVIAAAVFKRWCPRSTSIEEGCLVVTTTSRSYREPLAMCRWSHGVVFEDFMFLATGSQRGVVIRTPEQTIAVGVMRENVAGWTAFLETTPAQRISSRRYVYYFFATLAIAIGVGLGIAIGDSVAMATKDESWRVLRVIGLMDGIAIVILHYEAMETAARFAARRIYILLVVSSFFLATLLTVSGLPGAVLVAAVNGIIGGIAAFLCQSRARRRIDLQDCDAHGLA